MALVNIAIRSAHGPPVDLAWSGPSEDATGEAAGDSAPSWWLRWLRPELRIDTAFGGKSWAPAGPAPARSTWPLVPLALAGVLTFLVVLAGIGVASLLRR